MIMTKCPIIRIMGQIHSSLPGTYSLKSSYRITSGQPRWKNMFQTNTSFEYNYLLIDSQSEIFSDVSRSPLNILKRIFVSVDLIRRENEN